MSRKINTILVIRKAFNSIALSHPTIHQGLEQNKTVDGIDTWGTQHSM